MALLLLARGPRDPAWEVVGLLGPVELRVRLVGPEFARFGYAVVVGLWGLVGGSGLEVGDAVFVMTQLMLMSINIHSNWFKA